MAQRDDFEPYDLTPTAAAALIGVHADTLRRWSDEGKVHVWRTPSGERRYRRSDVLSLLPPEPRHA